MEIQRDTSLYGAGNKRSITASALNNVAVKAGTEVTIWSKQMPNDKVAWFGHGSHVREVAEAFVYAELLANGNGAGTDGDAIEGELVLAITDSDQRRVLASTVFDSLGELADAFADDRTNRPVMEAMSPYAKPGRHIELRVRADQNCDGYEVASDSNVRLYYSESA